MMKTKIGNKTKLIEKAKRKPARVKCSFTLDGDIYRLFTEACEKNKVSASRMLEVMMQDFCGGGDK